MEAERPVPRREALGRRVAPGATPQGEFTYSVIEPARPVRTPTSKPAAAKPATAAGKSPAQKPKVAAPVNRRGEGRTKSHLREGFVAGPRRNRIVDCRIRDLSRRGARISLDGDFVLPQSFLLVEAGTQATYRATLAWQRGRDAGVRLAPV